MTITALTEFPALGGIVPVAFVGRTSTDNMQDPVVSLSRQLRVARERLPEGFAITRERRGDTSPMATTRLTIGEFSRMTHLSVKTLRHCHDVGVLVPAAIDGETGYRFCGTDQVTAAQVIRRRRDLGMPLDGIRSVLLAPDLAARNRQIAERLERMERQLAQTQAAVSGLRALLGGTGPRPAVEFRTIPGRRGRPHYGALGTVVAERAIGVDGPIREYYPDGFSGAAPHRTEICWPVFRTGQPA